MPVELYVLYMNALRRHRHEEQFAARIPPQSFSLHLSSCVVNLW